MTLDEIKLHRNLALLCLIIGVLSFIYFVALFAGLDIPMYLAPVIGLNFICLLWIYYSEHKWRELQRQKRYDRNHNIQR